MAHQFTRKSQDASGGSLHRSIPALVPNVARSEEGYPKTPELAELLQRNARHLRSAADRAKSVKGRVWVHPYPRADGTHVTGHWREDPRFDAGRALAAIDEYVDKLAGIAEDSDLEEHRSYLNRRFEEVFVPAHTALTKRLGELGVPVKAHPELIEDTLDRLAGMHEGTVEAPGFVVEIGDREHAPSFSVWVEPDGSFYVDDVLSVGDSDFFEGPEDPLEEAYFKAVGRLRGREKGGYITLYRGMSPEERARVGRGRRDSSRQVLYRRAYEPLCGRCLRRVP